MNKALEIGTRIKNAYGETGEIVDRMYSEKEKEYYYSVTLDTRDPEETYLFSGDELQEEVEEELVQYIVETEILNNVCTARVYKEEDGKKKEVCRGHGHIIHEGDIGVVQALSYAFKKAYVKINGKI